MAVRLSTKLLLANGYSWTIVTHTQCISQGQRLQSKQYHSYPTHTSEIKLLHDETLHHALN